MRRKPDGRWTGDMTDGGGFIAALKRNGFDPKGKRALQIGAGGAGSALALSLTMEGASVTLVDLDTAKRDALIARLGQSRPQGHGHRQGRSVGLRSRRQRDAGRHEGRRSPAGRYRRRSRRARSSPTSSRMPMITPLLAAAQAKGCRTQNGVDMFNAQVDFITDFLLGK